MDQEEAEKIVTELQKLGYEAFSWPGNEYNDYYNVEVVGRLGK